MSAVTRWWWVRHAPVVGVDGKIYGSDDVLCDTSNQAAFSALAHALPDDALWLTSHLTRARDTAQAIGEAGLSFPAPIVDESLGEQDFGHWQGLSWDEMEAKDPDGYAAFWKTPARSRPPGGESFADQMARTAAAIECYTTAHAGRDIVAVSHGGTIRAAVAHALGLKPEAGMAITVHTLSMTRLDHLEERLLRGRGGCWRVLHVNQPSCRA